MYHAVFNIDFVYILIARTNSSNIERFLDGLKQKREYIFLLLSFWSQIYSWWWWNLKKVPQHKLLAEFFALFVLHNAEIVLQRINNKIKTVCSRYVVKLWSSNEPFRFVSSQITKGVVYRSIASHSWNENKLIVQRISKIFMFNTISNSMKFTNIHERHSVNINNILLENDDFPKEFSYQLERSSCEEFIRKAISNKFH